MYKIYTPSDFIYDIEKNISRFKFSIEVLINEDDLIGISKALLNALNNDLDVEVVIVSNTDKKSIRIYNLINRLLDSGADIYWRIDDEILLNESFFIIYDKVNVINKIFYSTEDDVENQVKYLNNIFKNIREESKKLEINDSKIHVDFSVDKNIINRNELITLNWNVSGASLVSIDPILNEVENKGNEKLKISEDVLFQLKAKNKTSLIKKNIFVKVLQGNEQINIGVDVFDPYIKEFISISPTFEESSEKYIVFHNQTIKLHWSISNNPLLKEKSLGKLINKDEHIFTIKKNMSYHFELKEDNTTIKKTLNFVTVRDNDFLNELKKKEFNSSIVKPKKNFFNRFLNFLKNK